MMVMDSLADIVSITFLLVRQRIKVLLNNQVHCRGWAIRQEVLDLCGVHGDGEVVLDA